MTVYIGLGSNLDDPVAQLRRALKNLRTLANCNWLGCSSLYRSTPVGPQDQPDFINAVACLDTTLEPLALLDQLQALEQAAGRVRQRHWGERTLDLDILLWANDVIENPRLQIPHPQMTQRAFVLVPLLELSPDLALPDGAPLRTLVNCYDHSSVCYHDLAFPNEPAA